MLVNEEVLNLFHWITINDRKWTISAYYNYDLQRYIWRVTWVSTKTSRRRGRLTLEFEDINDAYDAVYNHSRSKYAVD